MLKRITPKHSPKFKLGDVVQTKTGWSFQIDKIHKPTPDLHETEWIYLDVGGQGARESRLKVVR